MLGPIEINSYPDERKDATLNEWGNKQGDTSQKPEPDFRCACSGKACDGICREESGHFRGGDGQTQGGCTAAYRPPKPKAVRRPRQ